MDLQDQLKKLFPEHAPQEDEQQEDDSTPIWLQEEPLLCKYEKRKGKPVTIIDGYTGAHSDFKILAGEIKRMLGVGGSFKKEQILIQGDYRDQIMDYLKKRGFRVKRVGG